MTAFLYLLRRETWEHRSFYVAPIVVAALLLLATISIFVRFVGADALTFFVSFIDAALLFVFDSVMLIVVAFYLLDALYAERRDRSVLFWKSLPITDATTVGSKVVTAVIVVPLITIGVIAVTQLAILMIMTISIWTGGGSAWDLLWRDTPIAGFWLRLAYELPVQMLWYLPFVGWFLLASAWARKAPFLWAILPLVMAGELEVIFNGTHRFFELLGERITYPFPALAHEYVNDFMQALRAHGQPAEVADDPFFGLTPTDLLLSAEMWAGVVIGLALIAAAVGLRRYRDDV